MLTACAFWVMKISTTMRTAVPAISPVRMLLIFVRIRLRAGACGAGGAEPLAEGGGRVLVGPDGMAMAYFLRAGTGIAGDLWRFPLVARGAGRRAAADPWCLFLTYT